ncbi:N-acetylmuramoyl-L-alanine amidase [Streptacidiphilus sp. P02-A3a]|uniref:N-acetylmuramoyl-L-alanine amidase n=1 Tax=Streptacidiphilus sp. P02-A3a TaxID=2704468 RepID=UPI0015FC597A|nr:N-acetylmuramoyl-L-alanine amidase [Streptacidiphilus sp. P02-A3a]QMU73485.1 N-acetylmuramoyl-L-alanine amidase [Streptacidiphilus sp. P02-A3a]
MTQHLPQTYRRQLGDTGPDVAEIRSMLTMLGLLSTSTSSDLFDREVDAAVRFFQQQRGLTANGVVGLETYRHLNEARWRLGDRVLGHTPGSLQIGDDVAHLQQRLLNMGFAPGRVDGIYGTATAQALSEFQRNMGLYPDGTLGLTTFTVLERLSRTVVGGAPHVMRETEMLLRSGPALTGKAVVIDPGHGGADHGVLANGFSEAAVVWEIAIRLEERLTALGVRTYLTRQADGGGDETQRAEFANGTDANLLISLHLEGHRNPAASGVASYYYGDETRGRWSHAGKQFAGLVQRELVARCGLGDNRSHARTWTLLRSTRMAAVRIELGYLTNPGDAARIGSAELRAQAVESIAVAVQRLYLPPEDDSPTGVLHLPALA